VADAVDLEVDLVLALQLDLFVVELAGKTDVAIGGDQGLRIEAGIVGSNRVAGGEYSKGVTADTEAPRLPACGVRGSGANPRLEGARPSDDEEQDGFQSCLGWSFSFTPFPAEPCHNGSYERQQTFTTVLLCFGPMTRPRVLRIRRFSDRRCRSRDRFISISPRSSTRDKNAVLLAHYYQEEAIQTADFVGD
jgi:hypothetical protein